MKLISLLYFAVVLINPFSGGSPAISEKDISIIKRGFNKNYPQLSYQLNISYPEILDENHEKHYELNLAVQKIMSAAITDFQGKLQKKGNASNFGYSYLNLDYNICRQYHGALSAEIFIVVGTSLLVYPAAGLVDYAKDSAHKYIVDPKMPELGRRYQNLHCIEEIGSVGLKMVAEEITSEYA